MSTILIGLLRMPREICGDDPLAIQQWDAAREDAAEEIERLQASGELRLQTILAQIDELKRLRQEIDATALSVCIAAGEVAARHRAEVERLRAERDVWRQRFVDLSHAVLCGRPEQVPCPREQAEPGGET